MLIHEKSPLSWYGNQVYLWPFVNGGLGDYWACTNYFLKMSEQEHETVKINCGGDHARDMAKFCKYFIDSTGNLAFTTRTPTIRPDWMGMFQEMLPTKTLWKPNNSRFVTVQFDGRHEAAEKNPTIEQVMVLEKS